MSALGAEPHLNTCFKHYMYFVYEFNLIPKKDELAPLQVPRFLKLMLIVLSGNNVSHWCSRASCFSAT